MSERFFIQYRFKQPKIFVKATGDVEGTGSEDVFLILCCEMSLIKINYKFTLWFYLLVYVTPTPRLETFCIGPKIQGTLNYSCAIKFDYSKIIYSVQTLS